ncbi:MAG: ABC transporter substrate-binding protein [Candidatus Rokubacteria bacterium]|nr:ABC transporter substrate-binding protein [Candidatus Rokubacteria bacterium]
MHGDGRAGERQSYSAPSLSSAAVYDIAVESSSLVGNYRAQFDRVIRKSGYAELVRLIRVKRDQLLKSKRAAAN